jgi:acylphosphatase
VGYRFYVTRVARRLDLKGWIRNLRDGSVESMVEGEKEKIDEWIDDVREGPRYAEITKIDQETRSFTGQLSDFDVQF